MATTGTVAERPFFKRLRLLLRRYGAFFTLLGAVIGAISLYINNQLERHELAETVLRHVYCELDDNIRDQLFTALSGEPVPFGPVPVYNLPRVEFWDAVTNGGTLQYITDARLTFTLASAYSDLKDLRQFVGAYRTQLLSRMDLGEALPLQEIITASSQRSKDRMMVAQDELRSWFSEQRGLPSLARILWFWREPLAPTRKDCITGG
jgi:hypothetical protein